MLALGFYWYARGGIAFKDVPLLLPSAHRSESTPSAVLSVHKAASERARISMERADTASIQAAVREAETAALALMMIVQAVGERSPGRGPPPEPPPMLQDRASPAAKMDAGGKGSSLIGDARIEGDDDDDVDHAPMRPRHASARAPAPPAVQPAALTKPTAMQLEHESELSYGAGVLHREVRSPLTKPTALQLEHESELAKELDRAWRAEAELARQADSKSKTEAETEAAITTAAKAEAEAATAAPRGAAAMASMVVAEAATAAPGGAALVEVTMAGAISEGSPGRGPKGAPPEPPPRSRSRDRASPALAVVAVAPAPWPGGGGGAFSPAPWPSPPPEVPHLARAALLEELETKLSLTNLSRHQMVGAITAAAAEEEGRVMMEAQGTAFEAVAARDEPTPEAPGTTEIAYEWLGREMARDSGERDEERLRITSQTVGDVMTVSVGDIMTVKEGVQLRGKQVDKAKKALVGTSSFARGKRRHGCASGAGASPCRSSLATVSEQAEEPSLAEESSASLVACEEQPQEASSPSPSQMQRQLTLLAVSPWVDQSEKSKGGGEDGTEGGRSGGFGTEGWTYTSDGSHELGSPTEEDLATLARSEEFKSPFDFAMARSAMVAAKKATKEKHVVVNIDPSRSDVHNAAANLQRVRSSKALAAAASPVSSVSSRLAGLESSPFRRASLVELSHFS